MAIPGIQVWRTTYLPRGNQSEVCIGGSDQALLRLAEAARRLVSGHSKTADVECAAPDLRKVATFEKERHVKMRWFRRLRLIYSSRNEGKSRVEASSDMVILRFTIETVDAFVVAATDHVRSYAKLHYYHESSPFEGLRFTADWLGAD